MSNMINQNSGILYLVQQTMILMTQAQVWKRDTVNDGKQFVHDHNNLDNIFDVNNDESDDE